jgi:hypothetical protein
MMLLHVSSPELDLSSTVLMAVQWVVPNPSSYRYFNEVPGSQRQYQTARVQQSLKLAVDNHSHSAGSIPYNAKAIAAIAPNIHALISDLSGYRILLHIYLQHPVAQTRKYPWHKRVLEKKKKKKTP